MARPSWKIYVALRTQYDKIRLLLLFSFILFCSFHFLTGAKAQTTSSEFTLVPYVPISQLRSVSNDGKRIAFESTVNYNGGNPDGNKEAYLFDADVGLIQLTNTQNFIDSTNAKVNVNNIMPVISGNGARIVLLSNAPSLDPANPTTDGNYEIYKADLAPGATTASFIRITDTGNELPDDNERNNISNDAVAISDDGSVITFVSGRQRFNPINGFPAFTADNPDHNDEVIVCRINDRQYLQVTHSDPVADRQNPYLPGGFNLKPKISGNGTLVAWLSDFNYANANLDQNGEIFITQIGSGNIRQVTNTMVTGRYGAVVPVLDPTTGSYTLDPVQPINSWLLDSTPINFDGTRIVLESAGNFNGSNPNKARQLWLYNVPGNSFTMLTNQQVSASPTQDELRRVDHDYVPSINSTGTFIIFSSSMNLASSNSDGSKEIFRYEINSASFRQLTITSPTSVFPDQRETMRRRLLVRMEL